MAHSLGLLYKDFEIYSRHNELVSHTMLNLKCLHEGLSEPEFYVDLVYKFKKIMGKFRKFIIRYKNIGYNLNVMSVC